MRFSLVVVTLAAVAVGMVHLRRATTRAHYQVQRLQVRQVGLRRRLYDQQAILGQLTAPSRVRKRAEQMDTTLTYSRRQGGRLAEGPTGGRR